ncbi:MAG: glycosyltransferase family 4 protein [Bacteroidetes bacterium]|nr:glycosyltransferase family 4 protein [Bacteroidota bacterium]
MPKDKHLIALFYSVLTISCQKKDFMKQVLIDSRTYGMSGIGRYVEYLIKNIQSTDKISYTLLVYNDSLDWMEEELSSRNISLQRSDIKPFSMREVLVGIRYFSVLAKLYDIIHFTHTNAPLLIPRNTIITVHDIIPLRLTYKLKTKIYLYLFLKLNLKRFYHIITVSEFTKNDLCKFLKYKISNITTIYTRVSPLNHAKASSSIYSVKNNVPEINGKYFLYVGNRKLHKNLQFTIRVFNKLMEEFPDIKLVLVGRKSKTKDFVTKELIKTRFNKNFIELTEVDDSTLEVLYKNAFATVLLSKYEGFGLPPIEAGALGVPTLVSDKASLPEIVGNEICVVPIDDFPKTIEKFRQLISDKAMYQENKKHMVKRADYFYNYDTIKHLESLYLSEGKNI